MKKIVRYLGGGFILALVLQLAVFAGDKTFFIKGSNITRASSPLTTDKIEFFKNGAPLVLLEVGGAPLDEAVQTLNGAVKAPTDSGKNVQYNATIGDNLLATIWTPGIGLNNYYAYQTLAMDATNYSNSTLTWLWDNTLVDYKAAPPYKPTISRFAETTTTYTNGDPSVSSLTVVSADGSGSDGLREVNKFAWKMWVDGQSEPTTNVDGATGRDLNVSSASLTPNTTYAFKVAHGNQWDGGSPTWSDKHTYKIGGGVIGGGDQTVAYTLTKRADGFGVNTLPIGVMKNPLINNMRELVATLNSQLKLSAPSGDRFITAIGWWDAAEQQPRGYTIDVNKDTNDDAAWTPSAGAPANPSLAPFNREMVVQVSTLQSGTFTVTGTR